MNPTNIVRLNKLFEKYEYKHTWVDEDNFYDNKMFKTRYPQRGVEYQIVKTYGKEEKWLVLKGLTGAYPAKFFTNKN